VTDDDRWRRWRPWLDRLRRWWPLLALAVAAVAVAAVVAPRPDTGLPLDPASTGPDGTAALSDVLTGLDRSVQVVEPDASLDAPVVLVLRDQFTEDERDRLEDHVEAGARLVLADPSSPLAPDTAGTLSLPAVLRRSCDLGALDGARQVRPSGGALLEVPDDATGCYTDGDAAWLVAQPRGDGAVVTLGDAGPLTNAQLLRADHAVLAARLLTPRDADRVTVVAPVVRAAGEGDAAGLVDLIGDGVRAFGLQLLVAFLVVVAWRARRLGRPLTEPAPVRLSASDLTAAYGDLLARHDARAEALRSIRDDTRRRLARGLGLPTSAEPHAVARRVAERTGASTGQVAAVLEPPDPGTDGTLLARADDLADLEHTTLRATPSEEHPDDI
jgi:hypothetical protein